MDTIIETNGDTPVGIKDLPNEPFGAFAPQGWKAAWLRFVQAMPVHRFALWLRKPLKKRLGAWVDVEVWGLRLRLRSRNNLSEQRLLFLPKHIDRTEREFLAEELADGEVFLDIGANAGVYSLWMASFRDRTIQIEAFEPDVRLCSRLRANLERNDLSNVTLHECALGPSDGEAVLRSTEGNLGQNEISESGGGDHVPLRRLDSVLRERGIESVAAIKIDVEGYERSVLEAWFEAMPRERLLRMVVCEWIPGCPEPEVVAMLREAGYRRAARCRLNGIFKRG